jgi:uncharacterized protein (TIGR03083 family)
MCTGMTQQAIDALRAERELALGLLRSLSSSEWMQPSDCANWRVHDVFAHMSAVFVSVAGGPVARSTATPHDAERNADAGVDERRNWSREEVTAEYEQWSATAITALAAMQEEPLASTRIPLGNLGEHPMHILANALVFDHYCHLRHDLLRPNGPLDRPELPQDDLRLAPTMEWMLGGLPQMCADAFGIVDRPLNLVFAGAGGGAYALRPGSPLVTITTGIEPHAVATCTSTAHDFVSWGTQRRNWRLSAELTGDANYAARILDSINVI